MAVWWIAEPIPWGVTCLLPLAVFPLVGVMRIEDTAGLYGQNIFFWIWGTTMLGWAMEKHGLARRIALWFLSRPGVADSTARLTFMYMLGAAVISSVVSDAAVVAMMIPIGMSLYSYVREVTGIGKAGKSALGAFLALGTLYGSQAGGVSTIAGIPHNALSISLLDKLAGESIGWFEWMMVGVPLMFALLVVFYLFLRFFFPPEVASIPGGAAFVQAERAKLGPMSRAEINVLVAFVVMVALFVSPSISGLALGEAHPVPTQLRASLPIWIVPIVTMFVLHLLPIDLRRREMTLTWKDSATQAPWNIMILCMAAVGVADALGQFGFMEFMRTHMGSLGLNRVVLPYAAATLVAFITNVLSGLAATSLLANIFIPLAADVGFNTASMAMLVPNVAIGLMFPWSGATAGTAFASGYIELRDMIRVGFFATLVLVVVVATIHLLFAGLL
jgi:sodium-dependent dicarboxylate transporter 2/3/5